MGSGLIDAIALMAFFVLTFWGIMATIVIITDRKPAREYWEWGEDD